MIFASEEQTIRDLILKFYLLTINIKLWDCRSLVKQKVGKNL